MLAILKVGFLGPAGLIFIGVIITAIGAYWAAIKQSEFEHELRVRNDKIAELSQNAQNSVTGGDSFCYMRFRDVGPSIGQLFVIHNGKYPIYDVEARIVDLDMYTKEKNHEEKLKALMGINIHVGNLGPGFARDITTWKETIPGQLRLNIFFVARNGSYTQKFRRVRVKDGWATAILVDHNGKYVHEDVSTNYPRNNACKV